MNLRQKIAAELDARPVDTTLPATVSAQAGPHSLTLELTASGTVGIAFGALIFETSARTDWPTDALKAWGDRLVSRLTYLMEPLRILEVDPVGGEVDLRSQVPTERDGCRSYYEIRLGNRGTLRLSRSTYDEKVRKRCAASCQMTREALERLTDDLVASVG